MKLFSIFEKVLKFVLILIFLIWAWWFVFVNYYPCLEPLKYSIGRIDKSFNINQNQAVRIAKQAENIWEKSTHLNLLEYNPQAKAPLFEAYLNRVLPDIKRQKILAEYLGFVFIKHGSNRLKEEKALILYGTGANGKSVFFEIVSALLGAENISNYSSNKISA